jgi:hypothetical protein
MNFEQKYLKYKQKYLALKEQNAFVQDNSFKQKYLGLKNLLGGRTVRTIPNSGAKDGMTNQCLWISILDYLNGHGFPALTLRELRTQAGLQADTEHILFDIVTESYRIALNLIVNRYNLQIDFLPIDGNGTVLYNGQLLERIGNGANRLEIAQYGSYHFQLINGEGQQFVAMVPVKSKLVNKNTLEKDVANLYDNYYSKIFLLKFIHFQLAEDLKNLNDNNNQKKEITESDVYTKDEKREFIKHIDEFLKKLNKDIYVKKENIPKLEKEIRDLKEQIEAYEVTIV